MATGNSLAPALARLFRPTWLDEKQAKKRTKDMAVVKNWFNPDINPALGLDGRLDKKSGTRKNDLDDYEKKVRAKADKVWPKPQQKEVDEKLKRISDGTKAMRETHDSNYSPSVLLKNTQELKEAYEDMYKYLIANSTQGIPSLLNQQNDVDTKLGNVIDILNQEVDMTRKERGNLLSNLEEGKWDKLKNDPSSKDIFSNRPLLRNGTIINNPDCLAIKKDTFEKSTKQEFIRDIRALYDMAEAKFDKDKGITLNWTYKDYKTGLKTDDSTKSGNFIEKMQETLIEHQARGHKLTEGDNGQKAIWDDMCKKDENLMKRLTDRKKELGREDNKALKKNDAKEQNTDSKDVMRMRIETPSPNRS